jgi:hypothetical protein
MTNYQLRTGSTLTVNGGTLLVNGTSNLNADFAPVPVTVHAGATFGGTGQVEAVTLDGTSSTQQATLAPGGSPGILTATGNVVFDAASTFTAERPNKTLGRGQADKPEAPASGLFPFVGASGYSLEVIPDRAAGQSQS